MKISHHFYIHVQIKSNQPSTSGIFSDQIISVFQSYEVSKDFLVRMNKSVSAKMWCADLEYLIILKTKCLPYILYKILQIIIYH